MEQVRPPVAFLVLAVGGLGAPKRSLQVLPWYVPRLAGAHHAGSPGCYLLDQPRVAIGVGEVEERSVAGAFGVRARLACLDGERRPVQDVAHLDPAAGELVMGGLMSETISPPSADPGAAVVSPRPNVTEVPEPGGVNWTMRRPSIGASSASSLKPSRS